MTGEPYTLRWTWLVRETIFSPKEIGWVALLLSSYSNPKGKCFPSKAKLALKTGLAEKTIHRYLKALEAFGFITISSGRGRKKTDEWASNEYTLTFPSAHGVLQHKLDGVTYQADVPSNTDNGSGSVSEDVIGTTLAHEERQEERPALPLRLRRRGGAPEERQPSNGTPQSELEKVDPAPPVLQDPPVLNNSFVEWSGVFATSAEMIDSVLKKQTWYVADDDAWRHGQLKIRHADLDSAFQKALTDAHLGRPAARA